MHRDQAPACTASRVCPALPGSLTPMWRDDAARLLTSEEVFAVAGHHLSAHPHNVQVQGGNSFRHVDGVPGILWLDLQAHARIALCPTCTVLNWPKLCCPLQSAMGYYEMLKGARGTSWNDHRCQSSCDFALDGGGL